MNTTGLHLTYFRLFFAGIFALMGCIETCTAAVGIDADTSPYSLPQQALHYLKTQEGLQQSAHWPHVSPNAFLENLKADIRSPLRMHEGRSTNFCAYAALSYIPLHDDPLTFVQFMVTIYKQGYAQYGKARINPSKEVKAAAGTLTFKGELDIRPADQLWFLSLADHFKGYLNIFDHHYDPGNENTFWASVNLAKFNRMIRKLFNYRVKAIGSDLIRPGVHDIYQYLSERLETGYVGLYVNNPFLYKKNHAAIRLNIPTHFIILLKVEEVGDKIAFTYWDYGGRSLQLLSPRFLKKIIFGISHITPKKANAN